MDTYKIRKLNVIDVLKTSMIIFAITGVLFGLIVGLFVTPFVIETELAGGAISREVVPEFLTSLIGSAIAVLVVFIGLSFFITLLALIYNWIAKFSGGVSVYLEKRHL